MKAIEGYHLVTPETLQWKMANPMKVPYADLLEESNSEAMGARIWRVPPKSANTWHKHVKAEEFYFVLEGVGRIRVADESLTIPKHCGILVGPEMMRQIFNDTDEDTLWLIIAAPENEFGPDEKFDLKLFWPEDPKQLPKELDGVVWPPKET
jgi:mannose-6-phosphate isomerase-like protein (cupin superfamily)